ncbi:MAG: hypothetical protein KDK04_12785, partial [Candidatus Competibacteraceae bacterium]|nr:hypothetical protein [Candidatus Competibacteraceae bacterium]
KLNQLKPVFCKYGISRTVTSVNFTKAGNYARHSAGKADFLTAYQLALLSLFICPGCNIRLGLHQFIVQLFLWHIKCKNP